MPNKGGQISLVPRAANEPVDNPPSASLSPTSLRARRPPRQQENSVPQTLFNHFYATRQHPDTVADDVRAFSPA